MTIKISQKLSDLSGQGIEYWVNTDSTIKAKFVNGMLCGCQGENCQTGSSERTVTV